MIVDGLVFTLRSTRCIPCHVSFPSSIPQSDIKTPLTRKSDSRHPKTLSKRKSPQSQKGHTHLLLSLFFLFFSPCLSVLPAGYLLIILTSFLIFCRHATFMIIILPFWWCKSRAWVPCFLFARQ